MKIYTQKGDNGTTMLANGKMVSKTDSRVHVCGTLDELNSHLGLLLTNVPDSADRLLLNSVQRTLFGLGAWVAGSSNGRYFPTLADVTQLERWIDETEHFVGEIFHRFVLPGGCLAGAQAHVVRSIVRRTEREIVNILSLCGHVKGRTVAETHHCALSYINRLSDMFYAFAKKMNFLEQVDEITL